MSREDIYTALIEESNLSAHHMTELTEKRGFTPDTIAKNKFRSGNDQFIGIVEKLKEKFSERELLEAGVLIEARNSKPARVNPALLEDRIIIPYISDSGRVYHVRPHKKGLKDIGIEVYQSANLSDNPEEIILTEGELKAAAAVQLGISAIGIPGIGSFSKEHLPRLVKMLNEHKVKKVRIFFDNEVKDDPQYPERYKQNPMDRWDTPFYAAYMGYALQKEGFETTIGWLPDGWRERGKIDIDGALAQGRTKADFDILIQNSKTHKEFRNELPEEGRHVLKIKFARKFFNSHVSKEFNHYVATRKDKNGANHTEDISNFVIELVAKYRTSEGIIRDVRLINEFDQASATFSIKGEEMQDSTGFNTFCMNKGNFLWWGKKEDLTAIWREFFLRDDGLEIEEPEQIGWLEHQKIWLFGNVAIDQDGKEYRPDKNGIFWIDKKGIRPLPLVSKSGSNVSGGVPELYLEPFDTKEFIQKLSDTIGQYQAYVIMGWVVGVVCMEEIFVKHRSFPFLDVTGKRASGKTTIAELIIGLFGLEKGHMAADTTSVAVQRFLAYHSSMPFLLDEYRNEKKVRDKDGLLRNVYNRVSAGKGIKASFGIREGKIRGTLILSGEDIPMDNAIRTRCLEIYVSEKQRKKDVNHFNWFIANRGKISYFVYDLIKRKKSYVEQYMKVFDQDWLFLSKRPDLDPRVAVNYAIITAACSEVLGFKDKAFANWLISKAAAAKMENEKSHILSEFLDALVYLKNIGELTSSFYSYNHEEDVIYLWFEGAFNKFQMYYSKMNREMSFSRDAVQKYLKDEPYFRAAGVRVRMGNDRQQVRCMEFAYETASEPLRDLVENFVTPEPVSDTKNRKGVTGLSYEK